MQRLISFVLAGGILLTLGASISLAATGDILLEYRSSEGLLPRDVGWTEEGRSLEEGGGSATDCPLLPLSGTSFMCQWYGGEDGDADTLKDNDGSQLPLNNSGGGYVNAFDSPTSGTNNNRLNITNPDDLFQGYNQNYTWKGDTPYSDTLYPNEWIEFDDNGDNLVHQNTWPQHLPAGATPKGAMLFPGAPPYQTLRLVGGDGNGIEGSLATWHANHDEGKLKIKKSHTFFGPVTAVFRGALSQKGTGDREDAFMEVRATKSDGSAHLRILLIHFTDNALPEGCTDCGRIGIKSDKSNNGADPGETALIGSPDMGWIVPVNTFFTLRVIVNPDTEIVTVILNEEGEDARAAVLDNTFLSLGWDKRLNSTSGQAVFGLQSTGDYTCWVDYFEVLEGEVGDSRCLYPNPIFDQAGPGGPGPDGSVDQQDFVHFESCATGPAADPSLFDPQDPSYMGDACACLDVNKDNGIDQQDFGIFQLCYTGTGGTADPDCDNLD